LASSGRAIGILGCVVLSLGLFATNANAVPMEYGFSWIDEGPDGNPQAADKIDNQLKVVVSDAGTTVIEGVTYGQALFTFFNLGPIASSITKISFDDGTLLGISTLFEDLDEPGVVDFKVTDKGNTGLPAGNNLPVPFEPTKEFNTIAESPGLNKDGVDIDEQLGVLFVLKLNEDNGLPLKFDDVIAAIESGFNLNSGDDPTGTLRIGLHVQSIGTDGSSDSFIMSGEYQANAEVPLPAALPLLGGALGFLALVGWRRRIVAVT